MSEAANFVAVRDLGKAMPAFAEAYPRFDVLAAQRALREGRQVCVFDLPARNYGTLAVLDSREDTRGAGWLVGKYQFMGGPPLDEMHSGSFLFRRESVACGVNEQRWHVECPQCGQRKRKLVFGGSWACAKCHRLLARTQVTAKRLALHEERDRLRELVRGGKPDRAWSRTFETKLARLGELEAELGEAISIYLSKTHQLKMTAQWETRAAVRERDVPLPDEWWDRPG